MAAGLIAYEPVGLAAEKGYFGYTTELQRTYMAEYEGYKIPVDVYCVPYKKLNMYLYRKNIEQGDEEIFIRAIKRKSWSPGPKNKPDVPDWIEIFYGY